jgi:iron complex outermembrane receptor protein
MPTWFSVPPALAARGSSASTRVRISYEVGVKTGWLDDRLTLNGDAFWIDWSDLQLDVPNPLIPGRFYVANAGNATSRGAELELRAQPLPGWNVFGARAYTDATFDSGSMALGEDVGGHTLPYTPQTTWDVGTEVIRSPGAGLTVYGRAELISYGRFYYDATNAESQERFHLADFRLGVQGTRPLPFTWRVDAWVRNAFGEDYVPLAFPFPLAASGYVGEMGAPRTFGVTVSIGL